MPDDNIIFEPIGKGDTNQEGQEDQVFKQPIPGNYLSLYDELKARCDPKNFMNPYDPDKVSIANELYSIIISSDKKIEKLKSLRRQAMEKLGIQFSTQQLFDKLTKACNPKNYTGESYDRKRLDQANQLYRKILENADDIIALEDIEEDAREIIEDYDNRGPDVGPVPPGPDCFTICVVILVLTFFVMIMVMIVQCQ